MVLSWKKKGTTYTEFQDSIYFSFHVFERRALLAMKTLALEVNTPLCC